MPPKSGNKKSKKKGRSHNLNFIAFKRLSVTLLVTENKYYNMKLEK